jgi:hypothetical protein
LGVAAHEALDLLLGVAPAALAVLFVQEVHGGGAGGRRKQKAEHTILLVAVWM